jgi:hypothetical protein
VIPRLTTLPKYQEFYPQGLTEYSNATLNNIEVLIESGNGKSEEEPIENPAQPTV